MSRIIREAQPTDVAEVMQVMDAASNLVKIYFKFPISNRCLRDKSSGGSCHHRCRCFLP